MTRMIHRAVIASMVAGLAMTSALGQGKTTAAAPSGAAIAEAIADSVVHRLDDITDLHWHKGEYNHIVNLDRMIVAEHPDHVEAYANAGWLLWSMNRDDEAVALYKQGIAANPRSYFLYDELGNYYYNSKKDWRTAIDYFEKAAACSDCAPQSLHMLAHSYERAGRLEKALATWKRAATRRDNPTAAAAARNLERVQKLIDQRSR